MSPRLDNFSRWWFVPQNNAEVIRQRVVTQCYNFAGCGDSIQFDQDDTSRTVFRVLNPDDVNGVLKTVSQMETRPIFRYHRIDSERVTAAAGCCHKRWHFGSEQHALMPLASVTEWVAPLQFHPNRHNRFSSHSYYRFVFHL
jgi:hypothetical protein